MQQNILIHVPLSETPCWALVACRCSVKMECDRDEASFICVWPTLR